MKLTVSDKLPARKEALEISKVLKDIPAGHVFLVTPEEGETMSEAKGLLLEAAAQLGKSVKFIPRGGETWAQLIKPRQRKDAVPVATPEPAKK